MPRIYSTPMSSTTTATKKGGDKVVGFCGHNCSVLTPFVAAPGNRKAIFNRGLTPNINPNPRYRKKPKRGRKPIFDPALFEERFHTIARVFAWEDKFCRLLRR